MRRLRTLVAFLGAAAVIVSAVFYLRSDPNPDNPPAHRAFYFWQTEWSPSAALLDSLVESRIDKLYMRFFDVEWAAASQTSRPVAPLRFQSSPPKNVEIIPVVYLVNEVFMKMSYDEVPALAEHVWQQVEGMAKDNGIAFRELQIDCDWTDSSQRNYFHFINVLSEPLRRERKTLSATIRLHQVKYVERTGVPPVDRGMLMFYNFGRIQADAAGNSIFNERDASRYASYIADYPMKLDVVLPMFSWSIHARGSEVMGLLDNVSSTDAGNFDGFQPDSRNRYVATRSFFFRSRYFMEGDTLRVEETTPVITGQAAALAKRGAGRRKHYDTVALFDLSEPRLKTYTSSNMRSIFAQF
jgi:hypothetical protein